MDFMIIVYGTRLFGKADAIDGVGHVTCRFVHIMFVPLVPIETVFLLDDDRGMKLPFSFKAAACGWIRGGALVTGIGTLLGGIANFAEGEPILGAALLVVAVLAFATFPLAGLLFGRCSPTRRNELMSMLGLEAPAPGVNQANPVHMNFGPQPPMPAPQAGYHAPNPYGGPSPYGGPQPPAGGFGAPQGFGPSPTPQGYGPPPGAAGAYGAPPAMPGGFAPPPGGNGGYGAPPPMAGGYGAPPPAGAPYGGGPANYGAPPPGYGGPPGYDPNRR